MIDIQLRRFQFYRGGKDAHIAILFFTFSTVVSTLHEVFDPLIKNRLSVRLI